MEANALCNRIKLCGFSTVLLSFLLPWTVYANPIYTMKDFESSPISIQEVSATPQVIINASNDHQLFFKAYSDSGDLSGDGVPESTYTHSVDYYGYFDSSKCYEYDTTDARFEPKAVTADKYCTGANDAYWSGNFLNWASMTRIDTIRKMLFGGHRRVDTSTDTVLERSYLPPDIHSFAKHYAGADVAALTPYTPNAAAPTGTSVSSVSIGTGSKTFTTQSGSWIQKGDYLIILRDATHYMRGWVTAFNSGTGVLTVDVTTVAGSGSTYNSWNITNQTRTGITICNTTAHALLGNPAANDMSQNVTNPPLIRVAAGNYAFWSAGEVNQCLWEGEDGNNVFRGGNGMNYNNPALSGIAAAQDRPDKTAVGGAPYGDFVARVQVCVPGMLGQEKCKQYPHGNYKPIGLLQVYGDNSKPLLQFGMVAGTYGKARSGGDMVTKIKNLDGLDGMCREVNLGIDCDGDGNKDDDLIDATHALGDGTFKQVYKSAGGPITLATKSEGIINTWSLYRIYGYKYGDWNYNSNAPGDKCPLTVNFFGVQSDSECHNWGNPFSEIYLSSLRYFAGNNAPLAYQSGDGQFIEGINYNTGTWSDPLTTANYCSRLNIVNFNSSVSTTDTAYAADPDELDTASFGVVKDLGSTLTSKQLTDFIGQYEGIHGKSWFVGENGTDNNHRCTQKTITSLGNARGVCPEGPDLRGGFRVAGLAYYAHTNDIRPASLTGGRALTGTQKVDTYAVKMATGSPVIEIPVPGSTTGQKVTLLPSCIDNNKADYGCTMVDFKIVEPHTEVNGVGTGKFLVIWEDSLQGNDYDLDAGGTISYTITSSQITISTAITLQNLGYSIGHGYVISGTTQDGLHIHSGTNTFDYNDPTAIVGCEDGDGCSQGDGVSIRTYTIGASSAGLLQDPLWYAAKFGGFVDSNENNLPDLVAEWDSKINKDGSAGSDGIPDNYFYATNPKQMEDSLKRVFDSILERTSSGTAAAVVSSNVRGEGALYQAYYEPMRKDNDSEASWLGTIQSLWLDKYGLTRQDCSPPRGYDTANDTCIPPVGACIPNGRLDNYCVDQVVETYYDDLEKRTRVRVYESNEPDDFAAYSMQGVVKTFASGNVTMVPNSLDGLVTYDSVIQSMVLKPYSMKGKVTAYDSTTGVVTMEVQATDILGPTGTPFTSWQVTVENNSAVGYSTSSVAMSAGSVTFTIEPAGEWVVVDDIVTLSTRNMVGRSGEKFNNWDVKCLQGSSAIGEIHAADPLPLINGESVFTVVNITGDFSSCSWARMSSYDMQGTAGKTYNDWHVTNLSTILGTGASSSSLTLAESGDKTFLVTPTIAWLNPGDIVQVSNYTSSAHELYDIGYLWNGRKQLYLPGVTDTALETNRTYGSSKSDGAEASTGRHIVTWVDSDLDAVVDSSEFRAFEAGMIDSGVNYGFLNVKTSQDAKDVINYVRGIELPGTRNRTLKYSPADSGKNTMRLGDIINSTPTVVASPQEAFNLLYNDNSYAEFRTKYQNRRIVTYSGANDGLLHAFNAGFFITVGLDPNGAEVAATDPSATTKAVKYAVEGTNCATGNAAVEHSLGSELWAYAPMNLLPHLQWLKDPNYRDSHVYFMDAKPRVFDANIFTPDIDHPKGWGTVMVVGMNLGGGTMEVDTDSNDGTTGATTDNVNMRSAYAVFDITNPEEAPRLLAELRTPDISFSTVYPAVAAFRDQADTTCNGENGACNKWYLIFGTGPNDLVNYTSSQNAKLHLFDLSQLTTASVAAPAIGATVPTDCTVVAMTGKYNVITCDTKVASHFVGTPTVVDWDMDFNADTSYFGLVGDAIDATVTPPQGRIMRLGFNNEASPDKWSPMSTLYRTNQPVGVQPTLGIDNKKNKWVFFGTGRYFVLADKTTTATQSLYGIKDDESNTTVMPAELLNVTDVEVYSDKSLNNTLTGVTGDTLTTFDDIVKEIDTNATGWSLQLPPIAGVAGTAPATRNITRSALLGGALFSSVYQPAIDSCSGEGLSRLYGLYYKTGTAYPGPAILGTKVVLIGGKIKYQDSKYVDLGRGIATSPAIHSGSGTGESGLSVFTQLSTGDVIKNQVEVPQPVRTGRMSWSEE